MKALGGGGGSYSKTSHKAVAKPAEKPKAKPKTLSHSQLQAQWEQNGRDADGKLIKHVVDTSKIWTKADIERARAAKEKAEEEARQLKNPKPVPAGSIEDEVIIVSGRSAQEVAKERMAGLALDLEPQSSGDGDNGAGASSDVPDAGRLRAQLDELAVLEAMFVDDYRLVSDATGVDALRSALEGLEADGTAANALAVVASHPLLEFALQINVDEPEEAARARAAKANSQEAKDEETSETSAPRFLVASILLRVRLPAAYPTPGSPPLLYVEDAMVTEAGAELGADKVLTSCAVLDEGALTTDMRLQAEASLPDPCVWDMTNWMTEHAFDYITTTWL